MKHEKPLSKHPDPGGRGLRGQDKQQGDLREKSPRKLSEGDEPLSDVVRSEMDRKPKRSIE
jgi:hypothetical protein